VTLQVTSQQTDSHVPSGRMPEMAVGTLLVKLQFRSIAVSAKDDCPVSGAGFVHPFTCQTDPALSVVANDATNARSMIKADRIISIAS